MTHHNWIAAAGFAAAASLPVATLAIPHASAATALVASSNSSALTANVVVSFSGVTQATVSLPNSLYASGSAPPAYAAKQTGSFTKKTVSSSNGKFTLTSSAATIVDLASATAIVPTSTSITSKASSSAASFSSVLTTSLLPGTPIITVTATKVLSSASLKKTTKGIFTPTGSTTISKIVVNAPLLGINNATYTYNPLQPNPLAANTVLYQNTAKTVSVFLNAQSFTTTGSGATLKNTSIKVDAVDVHLAGFNLYGYSVNGDIEVGSSFAN